MTHPRPSKDNGTVDRVLALLRVLTDHPGSTALEISTRLSLPRSTVHRLLGMLRDSEFANHVAGGFEPGLEMYRIAGKLSAQTPYVRLAEPYLRELSEQFGETSLLTLLQRHELRMFHAASSSPADPMRYNIQLNLQVPLLWGATARAILAYLTEGEIEAVLSEGLPAPAGGVTLNPVAVRAELAKVRAAGYLITDSHRTPNSIGVAAPFFRGDGAVAGSVGMLIPSFRWETADSNSVIQAIKTAANRLSIQLGYTEHH